MTVIGQRRSAFDQFHFFQGSRCIVKTSGHVAAQLLVGSLMDGSVSWGVACAERDVACGIISPGGAGIPAPTGSVTALAQMPRTQPPRARHGTTVIDDVPLPICIKVIHTKVSSHSLKEPWLLHRIDWVSTMSLLVREQIRKLEYQ